MVASVGPAVAVNVTGPTAVARTSVGPSVTVAVTLAGSVPRSSVGPSVTVSVAPGGAVARSSKGPSVAVSVGTAAAAPGHVSKGKSVSVSVGAGTAQWFSRTGVPLYAYKKGGERVKAYGRAPIATWPRSYGAFGSYDPSTATTGLPDEFKSQAQARAWEGNYVVTDPYDDLDLMEIRGDLDFKVPYMVKQPDRLWVRGRTDYTTSTGLVRFMNPTSSQQIQLKNSTIEPIQPSQWTRGIEGWWFLAISCYIKDCQDGMMPRSNSAGISNSGTRGCLIDWLTYYLVSLDRASSGQTHNDCIQLNGADGFTDIGSMLYARYSSRGQFQPTILQDVSKSPIFNPYNDHPETAGVQVNKGTVRSQNLLFDQTRFYGGYFPFNFGDTGNDGPIGELRDCIFDSADRRTDLAGNPIVINGRTAQPLTITRASFRGAYAGRTVVPRLA